MSPVGTVIVFLLIWWLVLFAVLPMRVKGVWTEADRHARGTERGAPINPELWWKVKRTTVIAVGLTAIAWGVVASGLFTPGR